MKDTCGWEAGTEHRGHNMIDVSDYDGRRNKRAMQINSRRNRRSVTLACHMLPEPRAGKSSFQLVRQRRRINYNNKSALSF